MIMVTMVTETHPRETKTTMAASTFKPTKKAQADAKRLYKAGASVRVVAETIGCSYGSARNLLEAAGVTMRKQGGSKKKTA